MGYIKRNFDKLINKAGHKVLVKHTDHKQSCTNEEHNSQCPDCYGLNLKYSVYKAKVRRSNAQSISSDALDNSTAISFKSNSYKYFFKSEYPVNADDFIIEYLDNNIKLSYITNVDPNIGEDGEVAFKTVFATEVSIDLDVVKDDLRNLTGG